MTTIKLAVVIPFFQRQQGLLAAALASVAAQRLGPEVVVDIIVVDDGSPVPAASETRPTLPPHWSLTVIEQANAGVSRARNRALDAVSSDTDYVAFLDSDDIWFPEHLATALKHLQAGADFYFSNYFDGETKNSIISSYIKKKIETGIDDVKFIKESGGDFFQDLAKDYISQTSFIVYRFSKFSKLRFDERFTFAGEDHLFWLAIVYRSESIVCSVEPAGRRLDGISLYRSTLAWDSPNILNRLIDQINLRKKMLQNFSVGKNLEDAINGKIEDRFGEFCFLATRMLFKKPGIVLQSCWRLLKEFPQSILMLPSAMFHWREHRARLIPPMARK